MKKFLLKITLFLLIPAFCWMLIEAILPSTTFTHRHYEALTFGAGVPTETYWYPNVKSSMDAMGDLSHHTSKSVLKKEVWITDKLGYRNDEFVNQPDILFIGDSFAVGTSLTQEDIISNRVKAQFNNRIKVYNMSPNSMSGFDELLKTDVIKKPKTLIYIIVERNVPEAITPFAITTKSKIKSKVKQLFGAGNLNVYLSKAFKFNSVKWLMARLHNSTGTGVPGKVNPDMYFFQGFSGQNSDKKLAATAETIISYKKYCDSLGIDFIFAPMPDKETVYYEFAGLKEQSKYLLQLDSLLQRNGVSTINTLKIYNDYKKTNQSLLYHLDDTHWNADATALIASEIVREMQLDSKTQLAKVSTK